MTIYRYPACFHCSICIHVIPSISYKYPTCFHDSICVHVIPSISYKYPACLHSSAVIQIIPVSSYRYPACLHNSFFIKVIPCSGNTFPTNCFLSVFIVLPTIFCLIPAFFFCKICCNYCIGFYCMNIRIFCAYFFSVNCPVYKRISLFRLSCQCGICTLYINSCFTVQCHCTHCFIVYICYDCVLYNRWFRSSVVNRCPLRFVSVEVFQLHLNVTTV